jgi:hypothetical protein
VLLLLLPLSRAACLGALLWSVGEVGAGMGKKRKGKKKRKRNARDGRR